MIGKTIRDLKIIKEIGKGGMGVVYLAESGLGRRRSIKCLAPELTGNPQFRERFNQEARNQASLDHPNILQVTDLVEYDGQFLMIMDYVDGQGLDEIIREHGKIPEPRTLFIFKEMLKGLHFAHSQGLIHRDIKPSNILIDNYDRVRITDFGIAIMMGNERFTSTGFHIGTAQYMSPEQISRPKEVDFRTDVYSSGIVLYEMLTGEVPFDGDTTFEVMEKQVRSPAPNPMSKNAQISRPVAKMVLKALQKEPEQRFSDCRAFLECIEAYQAAPVMGEEPFKQRVTVIEPVRAKTVVEETPVIELDEPVKSKKPKIKDKPPKPGINLKMIAVFVLLIVGVGFFIKGKQTLEYATTTTLLTTPAKLTNSIGQTFVRIKPGSFMMGSPENEYGRGSDETQHRVTLTQGFYMQTTEVTQGQWRTVMGSDPSAFKDCGDDCPVEQVSWEDVQEFITKLNRKEGGNRYRLPTEAEWEYAARAGTSMPLSTDQANYDGNYPLTGCSKGKYRGKPVSVGSFSPNDWGLYDMHGNVWEWCQDWYADYPSGSVTDPEGPSTGSDRVPRGGGWDGGAIHCRSANRGRYSPGNRYYTLGFRLLRLMP